MSIDNKFRINICSAPDGNDGCDVVFVEDPHEKHHSASINGDGTISITKPKGAAVKIAFRLQSGVYDGYKFNQQTSFSASKVETGEVGNFACELGDSDDPELSVAKVKDSSRTLVVIDKNDDGSDWQYTLTIYKDNAAVILDPMIKNNTMA
ncbi:hypothetical protein JF535_04025 [Microbulbifer salipaludis]|uniref:Uncharacterized protein n=1 Tax=Microbulbifer salipaludis TaxID=187980 RepID=A0ABS3E400_9GAMM|nr:hypothetical protein [Microbulbifer salipaludis]MBN8430016.1 hypothetical protein [Microbulbifer salipaludis]